MRNFSGPDWSCLHKQDEETNYNIFMSCTHVNQVWREVGLTGLNNVWAGNSIEALRN